MTETPSGTMNPEASTRENVHVRTEGRTTWITLDRPPLNILDIAMMKQMSRGLGRLLDPPGNSSDFLIFKGEGPKGFSAGAEVADHAPDRVGSMLAAFHHV